MKRSTNLIMLFLFCFTACFNKQQQNFTTASHISDTLKTTILYEARDSFVPGKITGNVICKNDPAQSYAIYIPLKFKNDASPVIYFFDPHAKGSLPLEKYNSLADKYGYILIGSNNSKNGSDWQTTENIWNSIFNDSQQRLRIDHNSISTCGFSGGAKVASYLALHHNEIKAVIADGAGLPDESIAGNFNFSFTGIAGKGDMNMTDLITLNLSLDKTHTRHRIILFDGKHEWAPANTMNIAFAGLQLDAMHDKLIAGNDLLINVYVEDSKRRLNECLKINDLVSAKQECQLSTNMLNGLTDKTNWFEGKDAAITNSNNYKKQQQAEQHLFEAEQSEKATYQQQFQQGNMQYWNLTINNLKTKSKAHTAEGAMYQRLLAYLSLAFYSISNQFINNNQNEPAAYFVSLYKMADPVNSEAWYMSAIINARNNNTKDVQDDLIKAIDNGFTDISRIMQQPEFKKYAGQVNFAELERKIKK